MKHLLLFLFIFPVLLSCNLSKEYSVKLTNGNLISALDGNPKDLKSGDTVVVAMHKDNDWYISNTNIRADTFISGDACVYPTTYCIATIVKEIHH